jgi:hypothetical protein
MKPNRFNLISEISLKDLIGEFVEIKEYEQGKYKRKTVRGVIYDHASITAFSLLYYDENKHEMYCRGLIHADKLRLLTEDEIMILKLQGGNYDILKTKTITFYNQA